MSIKKHIHAFTNRYRIISNVLKSDIYVSPPNINIDFNDPKYKTIVIWDTGATSSVITKEIVQRLSLIPTGMVNVEGVHGSKTVNTYTVDIYLPNRVVVLNVPVTEAENITGAGALIGMDIIGMGDFAVSNYNNKTTFSFRYPSIKEIDFVPEADDHNMRMDGLNREQRRKHKKSKKYKR
jgi:hypothetical protein